MGKQKSPFPDAEEALLKGAWEDYPLAALSARRISQ